jgi:hypothetical protein
LHIPESIPNPLSKHSRLFYITYYIYTHKQAHGGFLSLSLFASSPSYINTKSQQTNKPSADVEMVAEGGEEEEKIKIGVCVMEKKVKCGFEVLFLFIFFSIPKPETENYKNHY